MNNSPKKKNTPNEAVVVQEENPELRTDDMWIHNPSLIRRFLDIRPNAEQLCTEVEYILRKKLAAGGIETSSITSRAKTLSSFLEKLQRKQYDDPLQQITDLAGARVVCLYRSDITKVAEIIQNEFTVFERVDKLDELGIDQFGYGAMHYIASLGKTASGARYDDLKSLKCEIQVRTVVQDAWAIIQHHMVYKREAQVPRQLLRKLNSLAGLFETVDDQFEHLRNERAAYVAEVRSSVDTPNAFLDNELNLDTYKEYLQWRFPDRGIASWDGQVGMFLEGLQRAGYKTLRDVDKVVVETTAERAAIAEELSKAARKADDGKVPSTYEPVVAHALTNSNWRSVIPWSKAVASVIKSHRALMEASRKG